MTTPKADILDKEVLKRRRYIKTERYSMSLGELTSQYKDGELIVHPEFQRFFRWDVDQKSRLIESILLGIPLPPIFVATTPGGVWELVDGLQRISTILELQGVLMDSDGERLPPLKLHGTKYLPALEGKQWMDSENARDDLSITVQRDIRKARLDIQIIERDSSTDTKYDLFQRLNSYGSQLTAQELRSCLLVSVNSQFFSWIESLSKYPPFVNTVQLPDKLQSEQYDIELVLRFLVLHNRESIRQNDLRGFSAFLDDQAVSMAESFPREMESLTQTFKETFGILDTAVGEDIFRKWDSERQRPTGSFLNTAYEVFAMGLGYHVAQHNPHTHQIAHIWREFWDDPSMVTKWATGMSTERRLTRFIPEGRKLLARDRWEWD